jgi:cytosine/adenosine deaminase-related metal-dependent hydrolase
VKASPRVSPRYVDDTEIALLGDSGTIISHQAAMAANRGVSPPIPALREAGYTIALGTDNNNNDMFAVTKVALLTEHSRRNDEHPGLLPQPGIHNGQPSDVESVMVDGQFIMRNHKVLTMDEDSIIAEADTVGRRIWNQVLKAGPLTLPGRSR